MKINFKLLKAIRSIATIGVLMYGAYYVYMNWESFRVLLKVNRLSLGVMLFYLLFLQALQKMRFCIKLPVPPLAILKAFG
jgi:hypothetical protein